MTARAPEIPGKCRAAVRARINEYTPDAFTRVLLEKMLERMR